MYVLGGIHMKGIKEGRAYEFHSMRVIEPAGDRVTESYERQQVGFEVVEIPLTPAAFEQLRGLKVSFPANVQVELGTEVRGGKYVSVVTSVKAG